MDKEPKQKPPKPENPDKQDSTPKNNESRVAEIKEIRPKAEENKEENKIQRNGPPQVRKEQDLITKENESKSDNDQKMLEAEVIALREKVKQLEKENSALLSFKNELFQCQAQLKATELQLRDTEIEFAEKSVKIHLEFDKEVHNRFLKNLKKWCDASLNIQKIWKGYKQRKIFYQMIMNEVKKSKTFEKSQVSDEQIIKQVVSAISERKLTLEQCFRAADINGDGVVTCEEFSKFLSKLDIGLNKSQLTRFILILDEDCNGTIEANEFYEALSAFKVETEKQRKSNKTYEQETLMRFINAMNSKNIEPSELFNLCDTDNSGKISLEELEKLIRSMNIGFKIKDFHALVTFLDTDKSGELSREEFLKHVGKAVQYFHIEKNIATSAIPEKGGPNTRRSEWVKATVDKMESQGLGIPEAFDLIETTRNGKITLSTFARNLARLYPHMEQSDLLKLIGYMDIDQDNMIDLIEMQDFLTIYSNSDKFSIRQTLGSIAKTISKQGDFSSFCSGNRIPSVIDISTFINFSKKFFSLSEDNSIQLFNYLDSERRGGISLKQLIAALKPYENKNKEDSLILETPRPLSPRSAAQSSVDEFLNALHKFGLKPINLFRIADKNNQGEISLADFQNTIVRFAGHIDPNLTREALKLFNKNKITIKDVEAIFLQAAKKEPNKIDQNGLSVEEVYWLRKLENGISKLKVAPETVFYYADANRDGKIDLQELRAAIKKCLPGSLLTYTDICYISQAMDINKNGTIELPEFIKRLKDGKESSHSDAFLEEYGKTKANRNDEEINLLPPIPRTPGISIKPKRSLLPPIPLRNLLQNEILINKFQKLIIQCPSSFPIHQYFENFGLFPQNLINLARLAKIGFAHDLNEMDCREILKVLDTSNQGSVYAYTLFTVLDSFRYNISNLPIPQNPEADKSIIFVLEKAAETFNENRPLYRQLPDLSSPILDWGLLTFLNVEYHELELVKPFFPAKCYMYHLAAVLQSYQYSISLCGEQVMLCAFNINNIRQQAPIYFAPYNLSVSDYLNKDELINRIIIALKLNGVESDTLYRVVYGTDNENQPVYQFFTYFDMFLSMFPEPGILLPFPRIPISQREDLDIRIKSFYKRVSDIMTQPLAVFGINLISQLTEDELGNLFERHLNLRKQEASTYLSLLKFNKNTKIAIYHLITVLDTYRNSSLLAVYVPKQEINEINKYVSKNISALGWLVSKNLTMDSTITLQDFSGLFPLFHKPMLVNIFDFLNPYGRSFIHAHQIMALIDLAHFARGELGSFPFNNNQQAPKDVKNILKTVAKSLDEHNKNAYHYYVENNIDSEEVLDLSGFIRTFSSDFTPPEATALFRALEVPTCTGIKIYHFFACLETYCKNTGLKINQTESLTTFALKIPENVKTADFFSDMNIHDLFDTQRFARYMYVKLGLSLETAEKLFREIDKRDNKRIFGFQIWTRVDLYRSCIENGRIIKEIPALPYVWESNTSEQVQLLLKSIAQKLDVNEIGTCENYLNSRINVLGEYGIGDFISINGDLNEQQSAEIFKALDIKKQAKITFYHFLDTIESYRARQRQNNVETRFNGNKRK
ncbi:unnamed protein product [Blepharisma stoltei]|uniref:EF-hand domain-containing protein n=1 Tax=Blepharisma stoltei TaxID=1481888 RepID=A0AAU9IYF5_9CILI|nr:unnamed protein product [Blepharisma stoltei]